MDRIPSIRRNILVERTVFAKIAWVALAIGIPTGLRWFIDRGAGGVPFVTFFPAVLLATIFLGWKSGAVTALGSAVIANRLLRDEPILFYVTVLDAFLVTLFVASSAIIVWAGESLRRVVHQQEQSRQREELLKRELLHRVKNLFAVIQSLAIQTFRHSQPEEFVAKLNSRLSALNSANDLLGVLPDTPIDGGELIREAVRPFSQHDNIAMTGPSFQIGGDAVVPLLMAIHELCTNAIKYGALSVQEGCVQIEWETDVADCGRTIVHWRETGGPPVTEPTKNGLGSFLLRPQTGLLDVRIKYCETGLACDLVVAHSLT